MNKIIAFLIVLSLSLTYRLSSQTIYSNNNVEVTNLTDKTYLLRETIYFTANIVALTGPDGILLLDTGFKHASADLVDAVKYLKSGKVKFIINSHPHGDHIGANSSFGKDVRIIGHKDCEDSFSGDGLKAITFKKEHSFTFNNEEINCIALPGGHSPCDIIIHLPTSKIAYLGDMYLSESFPLIAIGSGARAQTLFKNLKHTLSVLPEDTRLISGHGKVTTMEDLKNYIEMVETTIGIVRKEMTAGKSLEEIQKADVLKNWSEWGKFFEFITKDSWIEDIFLSYTEN